MTHNNAITIDIKEIEHALKIAVIHAWKDEWTISNRHRVEDALVEVLRSQGCADPEGAVGGFIREYCQKGS